MIPNPDLTKLKAFDEIVVFNVRAGRSMAVLLVKPWTARSRDGSDVPGWQLAACAAQDVWWVPDRANTTDLLAGQINGATGPPRPVWGYG